MVKRLGFVGAGAMGSFVGGMLARAHHDVTLIDAWPEHIKAIKEKGLRITGTHGRNTVGLNALHIHEMHKLAPAPLDVAFVSVKAYDTEWATALVKDYLSPDAVVVSLQNGFNEMTISRVLGGQSVLGCIASTLGAEIVGPGEVSRAYEPGGDSYAVFRVGEVDGLDSLRLRSVVDLLATVDTTKATSNLFGERWSKLVANSMVNPLAAITGLRDREMSMNPEVRRLSMLLAIEAVNVGRAAGYSLVPIFSIPVDRWVAAGNGQGIDQLDLDMARMAERATDKGRSSTPVDIALGRKTELDYFNGLVISKGREFGIPTPLNESVMTVVSSLERGQLQPGLDALKGIGRGSDCKGALSLDV